jgi:hypothetical protein
VESRTVPYTRMDFGSARRISRGGAVGIYSGDAHVRWHDRDELGDAMAGTDPCYAYLNLESSLDLPSRSARKAAKSSKPAARAQ